MIPIPPHLKRKMISWLPARLGGKDYPVVESDNIVPELITPAVTFYFSTAGTPSLYSWSPLRRVPNQDGTVSDCWGGYYLATMNVVLRAYDKTELETMWYEFIKQCQQRRRDLVIALDGVRFREILNSLQIPPERMDNGRTLYRSQVDLLFEYEISDVPDEDYIKRVHTSIQSQTVPNTGDGLHVSPPLEFEREVVDRELLVRIRAYISP